MKKFWQKTPALPPDAQTSSCVRAGNVEYLEYYAGPEYTCQAPALQQRYAPHELYELPDQLAVVTRRSDIHSARALAPPTRYQGEVIGAGDYDALREDNELSSAIGFSNVALEMLDAENVAGIEGKEAIAGGGGVEIGPPDVDMKSVNNGPPSDFIFMNIPIHSPADGMSASLSTPFSLPGPISPSFEPGQKLSSQTAPPPVSQNPSTEGVVPAPVPIPTQKTTISRNLNVSYPRFRVLSPEDVVERDLKRGGRRKSPAPKRFCCF